MKQSKSHILRRAINKALDEGIDLSDTAKRDAHWREFCKSHPDFDYTRGRTLYVKICKQCYEEQNVDLAKVGLTRKKTYKFDTKLAAELKAQAQESKVEQQMPESQPNKILYIQDQHVVYAIKYNHWTTDTTGKLIRCVLSPLVAIYPQTKLSDDTIESLAEMWMPTLQRFGSEYVQYFVIPLLASIGILASHVYTGYKLHKEQQIHN